MTKISLSRDPVDTLRTKYWYEGLRQYLRVSTAYAVERKLEPSAFKKNQDEIPIHRNKWWRYRCGLHTPNASTVERAENVVRGSAKELNHVLWQALRPDPPTPLQAHGMLRRVAPELQIILFEQDHLRIHGGGRFLGKLEHRASLDALACLTILLRLNHRHGSYERVWEYAHYVFRMLLMLGQEFDRRELANELFQLYVTRIFVLARWKGKRFFLEDYDLSACSEILYHMAINTNYTKGKWIDWNERVRYMRRIMKGDFGFDWKFLLDPLIAPDTNIGPPTEDGLVRLARARRIKEWSFTNALSGGKERFPPVEVWHGAEVSRRQPNDTSGQEQQ
jgi:hypothetical protein